jgi:hypothetical protein
MGSNRQISNKNEKPGKSNEQKLNKKYYWL